MVRPICSYRIAERLGAAIHVHDSAGHDLTTDAPDWCVDRITDRLTG